MSTLANYDMYSNEIKFVEKYDEAACALGQLNKKKEFRFNDLYKVVDTCLDEKISKKSFEQCIKGMILTGLVMETFTKNQKFRIGISPIGKEVHKTIKNSNKHLIAIQH